MQQTFAQYGSAQAVTTSDSTPVFCRAIYIGGAGNLTVTTQAGGTPVTFTAPPVGSIIPIAIENGFINTASTTTLMVRLA